MRLSQAQTQPHTGLVVLSSGKVLRGQGFGATGAAPGEVCFNTAMTGYQEILTDPSYAGQIITFTFPHIGNVGVNSDDMENASAAGARAARGAILREPATSASNYRAQMDLGGWMRRRGIIGVSGVDTRALTALIRDEGMPNAVIAHSATGIFDEDALIAQARDWAGIEGRDLAETVSAPAEYAHEETAWEWDDGYGQSTGAGPHIVVIDFGAKRNILRLLAKQDARVSVVPAQASFETIMAKNPDGVVLSNGPGDPAATGAYAIPVIRKLIDNKTPLFGICLGHQLLALAAGAKTVKMPQGHHGANHPIQDLKNGKVEIVSMNHGFTVDMDTLPADVEPIFKSLFDGSNSGIRLKNAPAWSVQHHPEASPGPQDSFGVFKEFVDSLKEKA